MELAIDDADDLRTGLLALVVTVVELLVETMEREAVRRMESGDLTDEEIERLGRQLQVLEEEIQRLKADQGVREETERLREELDGVVRDAVRTLQSEDDDRPRYPP